MEICVPRTSLTAGFKSLRGDSEDRMKFTRGAGVVIQHPIGNRGALTPFCNMLSITEVKAVFLEISKPESHRLQPVGFRDG